MKQNDCLLIINLVGAAWYQQDLLIRPGRRSALLLGKRRRLKMAAMAKTSKAKSTKARTSTRKTVKAAASTKRSGTARRAA
jgi:hypothetical protein